MTPVIFAMELFDTPSLRTWRISSSLPSRRDTPNDPFGRPSFFPDDLAFAEGLRGFARRDEVSFDFGEQGEQGEQRGHDLGLEVLTALEADVLLNGDEGHRCLGDRIEEGDDPRRASARGGTAR